MAHYEELPAKQPASASATRFERASNAFGLSTVMMSTVAEAGPGSRVQKGRSRPAPRDRRRSERDSTDQRRARIAGGGGGAERAGRE